MKLSRNCPHWEKPINTCSLRYGIGTISMRQKRNRGGIRSNTLRPLSLFFLDVQPYVLNIQNKWILSVELINLIITLYIFICDYMVKINICEMDIKNIQIQNNHLCITQSVVLGRVWTHNIQNCRKQHCNNYTIHAVSVCVCDIIIILLINTIIYDCEYINSLE